MKSRHIFGIPKLVIIIIVAKNGFIIRAMFAKYNFVLPVLHNILPFFCLNTLEFYLFAHFERRYIKNQNITMMDILALLHG